MPRIQGISPHTRNPLLRLLFWLIRQQTGAVPAPLLGYARSGAVLAAMVGLEIGMQRTRRLDKRLVMLAELRAASLVGCPFCLDIGSFLSNNLGISTTQIRDLNRYEESIAFSAIEKAVLRFVDEVTATPVVIDDKTVDNLRQHLGEAELVELSAAIAHENLRARLNHALGYGSQGFSNGGTCALAAAQDL